jgi:predicted DNA-binding ribbon-helix-helix protein
MKSTIIKRSIVIGTHKTSVSLEAPFWSALKEIASERRVTLSDLVAEINADRQPPTCRLQFDYSCSASVAIKFLNF